MAHKRHTNDGAFLVPTKAKRSRSQKTRRPKNFGIAHLLWLLDRHEEQQEATRGEGKEEEKRRKELDLYGIAHTGEIYFGRKPTASESSRLSQACDTLIKQGEAVKYPRVGRKTHLRLTPLGFERARRLKANGGCSPREIDEAVRAVTDHWKAEHIYYHIFSNGLARAGEQGWTEEEKKRVRQSLFPLLCDLAHAEAAIRKYLEALPIDRKRAEVKRIARGGHWEIPPMFTDHPFTDTSKLTN